MRRQHVRYNDFAVLGLGLRACLHACMPLYKSDSITHRFLVSDTALSFTALPLQGFVDLHT
jgi:hypothetical protein